MEKVNLNPYYAYFASRGQVFKLIHKGTIPRDILAYSDFVFDSDGTIIKNRYPAGARQFNQVVHRIRLGENIEEYCFDSNNRQAIDRFFERLNIQYAAFSEYYRDC